MARLHLRLPRPRGDRPEDARPRRQAHRAFSGGSVRPMHYLSDKRLLEITDCSDPELERLKAETITDAKTLEQKLMDGARANSITEQHATSLVDGLRGLHS